MKTEHQATSPLEIHHTPKQSFALLTLGAIGVVYGDIGTSVLYTIQECVRPEHGVNAASMDNIFGLISLIFWSLMMIVTVKYITFVMRADNHGEGGTMALLALLPEKLKVPQPGKLGAVALLVVIGSALLFGDGMITPAISVLSAIEGLRVAAPSLDHFVVPITVVILIILFSLQRHGTERIGNFFGPVMLTWFLTIGGLGIAQILKTPEILKALNPLYGIEFFAHHGFHGFRMLGSIVLAVTGAEALYADMGHFGKKPIQRAWVFVVFPCLILNYLGQGALLLAHPEFAPNPFYSLVPDSFLYPMIFLATAAAIIASQALISGAFSLTNQGIRLGYFPRVTVTHTSEKGEGQIYVPFINFVLAFVCILLVLMFRSSSGLASAYGLAVTGTMVITSFVFFSVTRHHWKWKPIYSWAVLTLFLSFDIPFFLANLMKFFEGGWIPFLVGAVFFALMLYWKIGRSLLAQHFAATCPSLTDFLAHLEKSITQRIPGTAVFLASSATGVPPVVMRMVKPFHVLHENVILLTITSENVPYYTNIKKRVESISLGKGFYRVTIRYGFMETPDAPKMLEIAFQQLNLPFSPSNILYVLGHETFVERNSGSMPGMQQGVFAFLSRNSRNATAYFKLPPEHVIELGSQIDL